MRRPYLLILLLLTLVATLLVLMRTQEGQDSQPEAVARPELPEAEVPPARLEGDPAPAAPLPDADGERERTVADDDPGAPGDERTLLRGTIAVVGGPADVTFDPPVSLTVGSLQVSDSVSVFPVKAKVDRAGPFAVDLTKAIQHLAARYRSEDLRINVDHPDYMPIELQVPMPDPHTVLAQQAQLERLTLTLQPAGVVHGVVIRRPGPSLVIHEWPVVLYPFGPAEPERVPVSRTFTTVEGYFSLRFPRDGRYLVAAPWAQAGVAISLVRDRSTELVELVAAPTYRVQGVVRLGGEPVAAAVVQWAPVITGTWLSTNPDPTSAEGLIWSGDHVLRAGGEVEADADGRFEVRGLVALPHRLRVGSAPGIHPHTRAKDGLVQVVTPPRNDVAFDLALARLEIRVVAEGRAAPDITIGVTGTGMAPEIGNDVAWRTSWLETDERGRAVCHISPACTYFVTAEDEGRFEDYQHELTAPAAGETYYIVAEMQPLRPKPALAVILEGEGADEVTVAGFGFYPPDANPRSRTPYPLRNDAHRDQDGVFRLIDLVPGTWRVHVRPGRQWHGRPGAWVEALREVQIPESGEVRLHVPIEKGARLHLHVTDVDGRHMRASCTITDERKTEVPAWFVALGDFGVFHQSTTALPGIGPCWVEPVLSPGTYRIVLDLEGYQRAERDVTLEAGVPTTMRVVLEREQ